MAPKQTVVLSGYKKRTKSVAVSTAVSIMFADLIILVSGAHKGRKLL